MLCGLSYNRSGGLTRHYFSAHRLVWRQGLLSAVSEDEFAVRQEALRRQQMSSRRRRRWRASVAAAEEGSARVSVVRAVAAAEETAEGWTASPWSGLGFTLPELVDVSASEPQTSVASRDAQTEPVVILPAPVAAYHVACQTETNSERSIAETRPQNWPNRVYARELIRFVRDRPCQTFSQLEAAARARWSDLSAAEWSLVRAVMLGIAWGLESQASRILNAVAEAQDDRAHGQEIFLGLGADLAEQAARRY